MYNILKEIQEANPKRSKNNIGRRIRKAMEELGEVSEAELSVTSNLNKKNKSWEDVLEESVDVAIVAMDIALTDNSFEDVENMFKRKLNKWLIQIQNDTDTTL